MLENFSVISMEWIEPNYNMVDITEYEMMLEKRRSIEDFVIKFFKDWECDDIPDMLVLMCKDLVTDKRLQKMVNEAFTYSNMGNFSRSFRNMCSELFSEKIEESHITVIFAFSIALDRTMKAQPWYSSSYLYTALIDSLVDASFNATKFGWNRSHREMFKTFRFSLLIILPPLLFFYYLYK